MNDVALHMLMAARAESGLKKEAESAQEDLEFLLEHDYLHNLDLPTDRAIVEAICQNFVHAMRQAADNGIRNAHEARLYALQKIAPSQVETVETEKGSNVMQYPDVPCTIVANLHIQGRDLTFQYHCETPQQVEKVVGFVTSMTEAHWSQNQRARFAPPEPPTTAPAPVPRGELKTFKTTRVIFTTRVVNGKAVKYLALYDDNPNHQYPIITTRNQREIEIFKNDLGLTEIPEIIEKTIIIHYTLGNLKPGRKGEYESDYYWDIKRAEWAEGGGNE